MHRLEISRRAMRSMRRIPKDRSAKILAALEELRALEDPAAHHNVKAMKGDWAGFSRMRIGSYRAIFEVNPDPGTKEEDKLLLISVIASGRTYWPSRDPIGEEGGVNREGAKGWVVEGGEDIF